MKKILFYLILSTMISPLFGNSKSCHKLGSVYHKPYVFTYLFMRIYEISYFKNEFTEEVHISYLRNLKTKYTIRGWERGFKGNISDNRLKAKLMNWILSVNKDVLENDCLIVSRNKKRIELKLNGQSFARSSDPEIMEHVFLPWFGNYPMGMRMKRYLKSLISP